MEKRPTPRQAWIAAILTAGEFAAAAFLFIHDGHVLALYLAVTYAVRETPGGREYHTIFLQLCKDCKNHFWRGRGDK